MEMVQRFALRPVRRTLAIIEAAMRTSQRSALNSGASAALRETSQRSRAADSAVNYSNTMGRMEMVRAVTYVM